MKIGLVYFFQRASGPIKIGYTAGSPMTRLGAVQTGCHEPVAFLTAIPGDQSDEAALHSRFDGCRLSGEWFRPEPELLSYIGSLPAFDPASVPKREPNHYVTMATGWVREAVSRIAIMNGVNHEKACEIYSRDAGLPRTYAAVRPEGTDEVHHG